MTEQETDAQRLERLTRIIKDYRLDPPTHELMWLCTQAAQVQELRAALERGTELMHKWEQRAEELRAALEAITRAEGVYSRDRNTYLENVIEWCKETARDALKVKP